MKTDVSLDYFAPFTYQLDQESLEPSDFEWKDASPDGPDDDADSATDRDPETVQSESTENVAPLDVSQSDLSYFMSAAGRFTLLTAAEEKHLGMTLWECRRRLLRILRHARCATIRPAADFPVRPHRRPVTASSRRRLARVEAQARKIAETLERHHRRSPFHDFKLRQLRAAQPHLVATFRDMDAARQSFVEHNLRLVVWVAKSFRNRGFDFIDVIQEGSLGLMRAIDRFDPLVGARFSTFATHWIKQGIRRALAEKARTIRIPVNRIPEVRETLSARSRLAERLGRAAQPDEIARELGMPTSKIEELLPAIAPIESIEAPLSNTDRNLGELLEDRKTPTPFDDALEAERIRAVADALDELPNRQRIILAMRHGIGYPKECTLEEIGDALGLSRERIRQVEKVATATLRDVIRERRPQLACSV